MTTKLYILFFVAASLLQKIGGECPNACSGHGKCTLYGMCICARNWMDGDCSQRVCQFGTAHVDTPKGDLDASGRISGPSTTVVQNNDMYPYGTTEQYPAMQNSDLSVIANSAHGYMECSNKGICDRSTGLCRCLESYGGSACQRAECPSTEIDTESVPWWTGSTPPKSVCSGHGSCEVIKLLAARDYLNVYNLWDEYTTFGCNCDGGYTGPDCSQRICAYGADPLYTLGLNTKRYTNFTYEVYTKSTVTLSGYYALIFYDRTGEDWQTLPISITATCTEVTAALTNLPNDIITPGSVLCYQHQYYTSANVPIYDPNIRYGGYTQAVLASNSNGYPVPKFTIAFSNNPGYLKQVSINNYIFGFRPSIVSSDTSYPASFHIYANGFMGEDTDVVPDLCEGVLVTLQTSGTTAYTHSLQNLNKMTTRALKRCLGDSDGDNTNNVEIYGWDYGYGYAASSSTGAPITVLGPSVKTQSGTYAINSYQNPHLIKLIDATQANLNLANEDLDPFPKTLLCSSTAVTWCSNINPPGFYAVLYFDGLNFNIFTRAASDYSSTTLFHVFTTQGFLRRVSPIVQAFNFASLDSDSQRIDKYYSNVMELQNSTSLTGTYYGNIDCETNPTGTNGAVDCLNKGDYVMFINTAVSVAGLASNPKYPNIYKVMKISRQPKNPASGNQNSEKIRHQIVLDYGTNAPFGVQNGNPQSAYSLSTTATGVVTATVYKFYPPAGYTYVSQCANRGVCDVTTGVCDCFRGYYGGDCSMMEVLAS